jgi:hypothetical protein
MRCISIFLSLLAFASIARAQTIDVEAQPLADNVSRVLRALDELGNPLPADQFAALTKAAKAQDVKKLQQLLEPHVFVDIYLNPEARVKAKRGEAPAALQQGGYTAFLIKVHNESTVTKPLRIASPQALPIHSGGRAKGKGIITIEDVLNRFLDVEMYTSVPMTEKLSGLKLEYAIALIYSNQAGVDKKGLPIAGKRAATLIFDVGQGTQDVGGRSEVPVLFDVKPAIPVRLIVNDFDGSPTTGRFTFKDKLGRVYPSKAKRLAPDFFFQDQIYRHSGTFVLLPPGELNMTYTRGPEYKQTTRKINVPEKGDYEVVVNLERWINPKNYGFYSGDHHIHAAGCSHYTNPTEGVFAEDMFLHVKGEGLNVGCNLTWGPCYDFQRQFFEPTAHKISEPFTVLKYDIEVSGFGSQALGHVCLLNLRDQTYPGSKGTKTEGWPTWTTPLMRWAKLQGAYTGYAHSASGLGVNPKEAAIRFFQKFGFKEPEKKVEEIKDGKKTADEKKLDRPKDGEKKPGEKKTDDKKIDDKKIDDKKEDDKTIPMKFWRVSERMIGDALLPLQYEAIDTDNNGFIDLDELIFAHTLAQNRLPNHAIPEMNGIGAQEICVTTAQGICDFISAMDTNRVPEWNCWYHLMNCGYPLKVSGETDFPCITDSRVGQGRVYVQLGTKIKEIHFKDWAEGLAKGRSYVSDGYAHALEFSVKPKVALTDKAKLERAKVAGEKLHLEEKGRVIVKARVAFASEMPLGTAQGGKMPVGKTRFVEVVVNGEVGGKKDPDDKQIVFASKEVPADGLEHELTFEIDIHRSSWVALRNMPQMHTNPIEVIVNNNPIRASKKSAQWCMGVIDQLWKVRASAISKEERQEAERVFEWAKERYRKIAEESPKGS